MLASSDRVLTAWGRVGASDRLSLLCDRHTRSYHLASLLAPPLVIQTGRFQKFEILRCCAVCFVFLHTDRFTHILYITCTPTCLQHYPPVPFGERFDVSCTNGRSDLFTCSNLIMVHIGMSLPDLVDLHDHLARWRIFTLPDRIMDLDIEFPRISFALFAIKRARNDRTYERKMKREREEERKNETPTLLRRDRVLEQKDRFASNAWVDWSVRC